MNFKRKMQITNLVLILLGAALIILYQWRGHEIHKEIIKTQEPALEQAFWGTIKSQDINARGIRMILDENPIEVRAFMDEAMQLFIAVSDVQRCFQCTSGLYEQTLFEMQKKDTVVQFPVNESCYYINGNRVEDGRSMQIRDGGMYLPLSVLAEQFLCTYSWDAENNTVQMNSQWTDAVVPVRYNLQEHGRETIIKNQGRLGTCWAVASLSALETALRPEETLLFATDHMSIRNSFYMSQNDGGEYTMSMAYLLGWQGPVLESDDPYGDKISPVGLTAVKHVQEVQIFKEKDIEKMKQAVFFHGAVQSSIYTSLRRENSRSVYYNKKEAAYCYDGDEQQNHEIIIIGWDDTYPKENFNVEVEGDGAFICQNSWGTGFGKNGIFYVSYYDTHIGSQSVVYTKVDNPDNYDKLYQTDLCGWAGQLGYNTDTAYFANAFTADSEESIRAVGFYATDKDTSYEVYYVADFRDAGSLGSRVMVASGQFKEAGYYTVPFSNAQIVGEEQKFAIVVKITTPNSVHPVAVEYAADEATKNVVLTDGEGYISMYGSEWSNVESEQNCNVCMKVYADKIQN